VFVYDTKKKKSPTQASQWSSEQNHKHKVYDSFSNLDLENTDSLNNNPENEALQWQPAPTPNAAPASGGSALPSDIRKRFEKCPGFSLADVPVYCNSDETAKLSTLAYAQGNIVHVGSRQEQYLPHYVGHVIQQKRGVAKADRGKTAASINGNCFFEQQVGQLSGNFQLPIQPRSGGEVTQMMIAPDTDGACARDAIVQLGWGEKPENIQQRMVFTHEVTNINDIPMGVLVAIYKLQGNGLSRAAHIMYTSNFNGRRCICGSNDQSDFARTCGLSFPPRPLKDVDGSRIRTDSGHYGGLSVGVHEMSQNTLTTASLEVDIVDVTLGTIPDGYVVKYMDQNEYQTERQRLSRGI